MPSTLTEHYDRFVPRDVLPGNIPLFEIENQPPLQPRSRPEWVEGQSFGLRFGTGGSSALDSWNCRTFLNEQDDSSHAE